MAHIREIKKRIKVAQNIQQITRAMAMVATVRLRKAQERVTSVRPYTERLGALLRSMVPEGAEVIHPLMVRREPVTNVLLVPITADKGLCGSYNTNIVRRTMAMVSAMPQAKTTLFILGKKGYDQLRRTTIPIAGHQLNLLRTPNRREAAAIALKLAGHFLSREYDEIHVIYNRFVSAAVQVVEVERFLPISFQPSPRGQELPITEPNLRAALDALTYEWLKARMYHYLVEAAASELGARRTAMDAATDNASEIIAQQTLALNRARQTAITMEILDIINGAEALK